MASIGNLTIKVSLKLSWWTLIKMRICLSKEEISKIIHENFILEEKKDY